MDTLKKQSDTHAVKAVKDLCELHDILLCLLNEKIGFKIFWANEISEMATVILHAATELDKASRQVSVPETMAD